MTPKQIRELAELVTRELFAIDGGVATHMRIYFNGFHCGGMQRRTATDNVRETITKAVRAMKRKAAK